MLEEINNVRITCHLLDAASLDITGSGRLPLLRRSRRPSIGNVTSSPCWLSFTVVSQFESKSPMVSSSAHTWSETPAAIAGVTRSVL